MLAAMSRWRAGILWIILVTSSIGAIACAGLWIRSHWRMDFVLYHWKLHDVVSLPPEPPVVRRTVVGQYRLTTIAGEVIVGRGWQSGTKPPRLGWQYWEQLPWSGGDPIGGDANWLGVAFAAAADGLDMGHPRAWVLRFPLWMPFVVLLAVCSICTFQVLRLRRRACVGLCAVCGYDLRASPERCPECGKQVVPASIRQQAS